MGVLLYCALDALYPIPLGSDSVDFARRICSVAFKVSLLLDVQPLLLVPDLENGKREYMEWAEVVSLEMDDTVDVLDLLSKPERGELGGCFEFLLSEKHSLIPLV